MNSNIKNCASIQSIFLRKKRLSKPYKIQGFQSTIASSNTGIYFCDGSFRSCALQNFLANPKILLHFRAALSHVDLMHPLLDLIVSSSIWKNLGPSLAPLSAHGMRHRINVLPFIFLFDEKNGERAGYLFHASNIRILSWDCLGYVTSLLRR